MGKRAALAIVPADAFTYCFEWHCRHAEWNESHTPGSCCFCHRDIAVPSGAKGKSCGCIPCGFDRGEILEIDKPLTGDHDYRL